MELTLTLKCKFEKNYSNSKLSIQNTKDINPKPYPLPPNKMISYPK